MIDIQDKKFTGPFFDDEEKKLIESIERGEWKPVDNPREWDKVLKDAARNYVKNKSK